MKHDVEASLDRLTRWVEEHDYKAYDPGDGQMSYLRHLTFGQPALERLLTATVLRTPFNIRPLLGIKPHTSTKGMGYMAWGHLRRFQATGDPHHAERARTCLDWLLDHRSPGIAICAGAMSSPSQPGRDEFRRRADHRLERVDRSGVRRRLRNSR